MMIVSLHVITGGETWVFPDPLNYMTWISFVAAISISFFRLAVRFTPKATWSNKWAILTHETLFEVNEKA